MPTILNNQANITYDYTGAASSESAESNSVATTLLDEYSMIAAKTALSSNFRPGDNITYAIRLENNGRGDLYNLQITDNLGSTTTSKPLTFSNAILYVNNNPTAITPTTNADNSITFQVPSPFSSGDVAILVYNANVNRELSSDVSSITNTAAITANGGSATGPAVTVDPDVSATVNVTNYAQLFISKQSDKDTITSGDSLTYTFTINNTGNQQANNVVLTDKLPENFTINQISVTSGGNTTIYQPSEYNLDSATNTLTLPNSSGTAISVPANSSATVQITGTVTI